jgi:predicted hotdog family 3-hydroxylacyl-ACP dehydratase
MTSFRYGVAESLVWEEVDNQAMPLPAVEDLLPHAPPMVLLDDVLAVSDRALLAMVTPAPNSSFAEAHGIPVVVGIEYMAQAIAAFAGFNALRDGEPVKPGFLVGTRRYEAHTSWFAIDLPLYIRVEKVVEADSGLGVFACEIHGGRCANQAGQLLVSSRLNVFQPADADAFLAAQEESN